MPIADFEIAVPTTMRAAVYKGNGVVSVEEVPTPTIGAGELLVRVEACGICHTDLKKIEHNLLAPPRIYGHETAGVVASAGRDVRRFAPGDRVVVFHHIPCLDCFYCRKKLYAQYGCYQCHGYAAQGGAGPRLAPRPLAYTAFSKYVRQPSGEMPPYTAKVMSDAQAADLYAYIKAFQPSPAAKDIPLLNQIN